MTFVGTFIGLVLVAGIVTACSADSPAKNSQDDAVEIAKNRNNYKPENDVEGKNYNARQALADSPATLIWCTAFPTSPNAKAFTVAVVGKLTSGNKRPYPVSQTIIDGDTLGMTYNPELPGPDGMYGSSGEYRYGFDPAGNYVDFYNLETFCTNVPNVMQQQETIIALKPGSNAALVDGQIEAALKACRDKDPDPSHPCPAAAALLGAA